MKPMFLRDVENAPPAGLRGELLGQMRASGKEYPQIWHLFAFRPDATDHLGAFAQAFYNRWIDATGVHAMSEEAHREFGRRTAKHGYSLK